MEITKPRRVTIPNDSIGLVISKELSNDVKTLCFLIRRGRKFSADDRMAMRSVAGDLLLALLEVDDV